MKDDTTNAVPVSPDRDDPDGLSPEEAQWLYESYLLDAGRVPIPTLDAEIIARLDRIEARDIYGDRKEAA